MEVLLKGNKCLMTCLCACIVICSLLFVLMSETLAATSKNITDPTSNLYVTINVSNSKSDSDYTYTVSGTKATIVTSDYSYKIMLWTRYASTTSSITMTNPYGTDITVVYKIDNGAEKTVDIAANKTTGTLATFASSSNSVADSKASSTNNITIVSVSYNIPAIKIKFLAPELPENNTSTVTVNDIGDNGELEVENGSFTYSANGAGGYVFFGFRSVTTGKYIGCNTSLSTTISNMTANATESDSFVPVFVKSDIAVFQNGTDQYPYLDEAIGQAKKSTDKTVFAVKSGTRVDGIATHTTNNKDEDGDNTLFTIPQSVTLLLPYDSIWTEDHEFPNANVAFVDSSKSTLDPAQAWLSVTFKTGTRIANNGKIVVGGKLIGDGTGYAGATIGDTSSGFSRLILESDCTVGNETYSQIIFGENAVLSVCGYITGDGTIDATATGAVVYQPLVIMDYRGGSYVTAAAADTLDNISAFDVPVNGAGIPKADFPGGEYLFPTSQHSIRNIQSKLIFSANSYLYLYIDLHTDEISKSGFKIPAKENQSTIPFVGSSTDSVSPLFKMSEGAEVVFEYDKDMYVETENTTKKSLREKIGRTIITFTGNVTFGSINLNVTVLDNQYSLSSSVGTFIFSYNYYIRFAKGSIFTIKNNMGLFPGAELIIDEGSVLKIEAKMMVFDGLFEQSSGSSGSAITIAENSYASKNAGATGAYPTSADLTAQGFSQTANLIVNGSMIVTSTGFFGGVVQTTTNGAVIDLSQCETTNLKATQQVGLVGSWSVSVTIGFTIDLMTRYYAGATLHELDAMVYNSATGELVKLEAGKTYTSYYGELGDNGTYTNTISYKKDSFNQRVYTTSADPTSYIDRTIEYSATILGEWYTSTDVYAFKPEYRLNDYIWLNATFKVGSGITVPLGVTAIDENTSIVNVDGTYYLVRKVTSTELADALNLTICDDDVIASFARVVETIVAPDPNDYTDGEKDKDYIDALAEYNNTLKLIDAMLKYGEAAKVYFSKGTVADDAVLDLPVGLDTNLSKHANGAATNLNGFSISTAGVEFTFNEQIGMTLHMVLKKNGTATTFSNLANVVQVGVLVGDAMADSKGDIKLLSTNETTGYYDAAYILYQSSQFSIDNPSYPDIPKETDFSTGEIATKGSLDALSECTISFDLKSAEYAKTFSLRLYIVVDNTPDVADDNDFSVIYGTQYHYGLGNYIARTYNSEYATLPNGYDMNAYKNFMVATWYYKEAAAAAFGSET